MTSHQTTARTPIRTAIVALTSAVVLSLVGVAGAQAAPASHPAPEEPSSARERIASLLEELRHAPLAERRLIHHELIQIRIDGL